jgi:hypothetical protein
MKALGCGVRAEVISLRLDNPENLLMVSASKIRRGQTKSQIFIEILITFGKNLLQ